MKKIKNKIKAIIFDMDGTIVQTSHLWKITTKKVLEQRGFLPLSSQQEKFLDTLAGAGLYQATAQLKKTFDLPESIEVLMEEKKSIFAEMFEAQAPSFIDGFEAFHQKLTNHEIPTCIATNSDDDSLNKIVAHCDLPRFFGNKIFSISDVEHKAKPNPAIFLHAAKQLGVKPEDCVVFEDSLVGFQAAKAAGMRCIAIKNATNKDQLDSTDKAIDNYHQAEDTLHHVAVND